SELPAGCCEQATRMTPAWRWILSHLRSVRASMSRKSSVPQTVSFVSQVLKRDRPALLTRMSSRPQTTKRKFLSLFKRTVIRMTFLIFYSIGQNAGEYILTQSRDETDEF